MASKLFALLLLLSAAGSGVLAQSTPPTTFFWGFNNASSNTVNQCDTLSLFITNQNGDTSVPPYTLISYPVGGIGINTNVGSDPTALSWQVKHAAGSQLLLSMVDSGGNQGGVPGVYTVGSSTDTSCLPQTTTSTFQLSANSTNISTCDPLLITVTGGTSPYNLTIAVTNANVTNVLLGANDNQYRWIDRAPPGQQLLVSARDASSSHSVTTNLVNTQGSSDTTCPGLGNAEGNSNDPSGTSTSTPSATSSNSSSHSTDVGAIAGGAAGAAVAIIAAIIGAFLCFRRRSARRAQRNGFDLDAHSPSVHETTPYSFVPPPSNATEGQQLSAFRNDGKTPYGGAAQWSRSGGTDSRTSLDPYSSASGSGSGSGSSSGPNAASRQRFGIANPGAGDAGQPAMSEKQTRQRELEEEAQPVIMRHRDGGAAVVELPPAYGEQETSQQNNTP